VTRLSEVINKARRPVPARSAAHNRVAEDPGDRRDDGGAWMSAATRATLSSARQAPKAWRRRL